MRIALDLDGVLANSIALWIKIWNERNYPQISYEAVSEWDFWKGLGISETAFNEVFKEVWINWERLQPMEDQLAYKVGRLKEFGRVDILTGRPRSDQTYIIKWLNAHGVTYDTLIFARGGKGRYPYDVFIDDSPLNAKEIASNGRYVLLRDQPWNRSLPESRLIKRIPNLDAAIEELETLCGQR